MQKRRLPIIILALVISCGAFLCSTLVLPLPQALAHAYVIGSDPIDGSTINTLPSIVRIFFNAPISSISTAHVYAVESSGMADVSASPGHISATSSRELDISLKTPGSLPQSSYEIRWMAVANDDGHTTYGLIGFNFGNVGPTGTPTLGPSTSNALSDSQALNTISILTIAWEWLARMALALWIGILVIERFILSGSDQTTALVGRIKRQTLSLQWLCLGTLFVSEIVALILRSNNLNQAFNLAQMIPTTASFNLTSLPQLIESSNYGHLWLLRSAFIITAMGLLYWIKVQQRPQPAPTPIPRITTSNLTNRTGPLPRITQDHTGSTASLTKQMQEIEKDTSASSRMRRLLSLWLLLAGLIVLTQALSGDSVFQLHISAIVFDWLYRIVQGAWFGGITYLAYIVLPFLPRAELERRAETVAILLGRLVPYLLFCIGITVLGGLFFAEASLSNTQQFLNDPYGRAMLVQLIAITLALFLALYAIFILRPRFTHQALFLPVVNSDLPTRRTRQSALEQTWHHLKQGMNVQAWLGAAILLCSSFMAFYAPPIVFPTINYTNPTTSIPTNNIPTTIQTQQVSDLSLTLQVLPGKVNAINTVILLLTNQSGTPVTNATVTLESNMQIMDMGTAHKTLKSGNPVYTATFAKNEAFTMAGAWSLNVTVRRTGHPSLHASFQINVI